MADVAHHTAAKELFEESVALFRLGSRCYRVRTDLYLADRSEAAAPAYDYTEGDDGPCMSAASSLAELDEDESSTCPVVYDEADRTFKARFGVHPVFFKFIIGKKGATKEKLQKDTGATIKIPKTNPKNKAFAEEFIELVGKSEKMVTTAYSRILVVIQMAKSKLPPTHFISVPLCTDERVSAQVAALHARVLEEFGGGKCEGVDQSLCVAPDSLHVTLLVLKLYSKEELARAEDSLRACHARIADVVGTSEPLTVSLRGLEYMNDDPSAVDVLYLRVTDDGSSDGADSHKLVKLAEMFEHEFSAVGLVTPSGLPPKIHATLLNSRLRLIVDKATDSGASRQSFDARDILAQLGDVTVATGVRLSALHMAPLRGSEGAAGGRLQLPLP